MGRISRAISIGALLGVLGSLLVSVTANAVAISVTNQCTTTSCTSDSLVKIRGYASAPLVVTFNLGSFDCYDNGLACGSARTNGVTATSIEWRWEQANEASQWEGVFTTVSHTCTSTLSRTTTYCVDGQHLDQLVISGLSSTKVIQVQFRLVSGADTTSWMAARVGASQYEQVMPRTFVPTAAISVPQFLEVNESFTASAESSNANDGNSDLSHSRFSWDFYNTNQYDVSSSSSPTYAFSYARSGTHTMKLRISNYHSVTDTETQVVYVSSIPPSSTASIALQGGGIWTNTTRPTLEISWPKYAMTMNITDQDRTASSVEVRNTMDWDVTWSSGSGETKNIAIDFFKGDGNTVGDELTAAVSYDIDTPVLNSVSATRTDGALAFTMSATDQHSGLSKVEISNGSTTVEHSYSTAIASTLSGSNFTVRVKDLAGNWSASQSIVATTVNTAPSAPVNNSPASNAPAADSGPTPSAVTVVTPEVKTPRVAAKSKTSGASIASQAGVSVTPGSKIALSVSKASKKICKVSGGKLVALAPGNCLVTVSVTPKKSKLVKKPKAVKTPTTVVVG